MHYFLLPIFYCQSLLHCVTNRILPICLHVPFDTTSYAAATGTIAQCDSESCGKAREDGE